VPFYSGQHGQLKIADAAAVKVKSFGFSTSQAVLDTTSLEDTDRTIIPGIRSFSGTARLAYHQASAGSGGDVTTLLQKVMGTTSFPTSVSAGDGTNDVATEVTFELKIADGSSNGRRVKFSAFITSFNMNVAIGEVVEADVSFEANGAPMIVDM